MASVLVSNVSLSYAVSVRKQDSQAAKIQALSEVSFELEEGDRLAVIGQNGCGKSTLLRVLAGSLFPQSGEVKVEGDRLALLNRDYGLFRNLTVAENAKLKAFSLGLKSKQASAYGAEVIQESGLNGRDGSLLGTLSTGMVGKFNLALNSRIIRDVTILDEWIGTLDVGQLNSDGFLNRLNDQAKIVVLASHNEVLTRRLCNKVLLLRNGTVEYFGTNFDEAYGLLRQHQAPVLAPVHNNKSPQRSAPIYFIHPYYSGHQLLKWLISHDRMVGEQLVMLPRGSTIESVPKGARIVMCYRDPLERLARSYEGRARQGLPYYSSHWTPLEKKLFERHPTFASWSAEITDDRSLVGHLHEFLQVQNVMVSARLFFGELDVVRERESQIEGLVNLDFIPSALRSLGEITNQGDNFLEIYRELDSIDIDYFEQTVQHGVAASAIAPLRQLLAPEYEYLDRLKQQVDRL